MSTATWSVIVSGIVAVSVPTFSWLNQNSQRRFERLEAFQNRAWESKADAFPPVITAARKLSDEISKIVERPVQEGVVKAIARLRDAVQENLAVIETYGSTRCREASIAFLRSVDQMNWNDISLIMAESHGYAKEAAIDTGDFDAAALERSLESRFYKQFAESFDFDDVAVHQQMTELVDACRADLRAVS